VSVLEGCKEKVHGEISVRGTSLNCPPVPPAKVGEYNCLVITPRCNSFLPSANPQWDWEADGCLSHSQLGVLAHRIIQNKQAVMPIWGIILYSHRSENIGTRFRVVSGKENW